MWNRYYHITFMDEEKWNTTTVRNLFKVCHSLSSSTGIQAHVSIAPAYSLKICIWFFIFYVTMLSSLRNKKHCQGPLGNKEIHTWGSSRAQSQMNWSWALMVMKAMSSFPIPDWIKPALPLSKASFPSIKLSEHFFYISDDLQWAQFN